MVLLIIIPMKNGYFIGNIPYFQTNPFDGQHQILGCHDCISPWNPSTDLLLARPGKNVWVDTQQKQQCMRSQTQPLNKNGD